VNIRENLKNWKKRKSRWDPKSSNSRRTEIDLDKSRTKSQTLGIK